jgi:hypothetical protein
MVVKEQPFGARQGMAGQRSMPWDPDSEAGRRGTAVKEALVLSRGAVSCGWMP